ncbi:MAG: MFS transporter [Firmicutes bacterium]|nr:MFS transporter [Bacillota bacterium]
MERRLNVSYSCIQGTYWMVYAVVGSFASVFLLARGYTNSEIGVILAAANVVAVPIQPLVADFADRSKKISLIGIIQWMSAILMVLMAGLCIFQRKTLALSAIFMLLLAWHTAIQPLINTLSFKLEETGAKINFGVARSIGSLAYAGLCAVLGTFIENHGVGVMPISGEIVIVMLLASLYVTKKYRDRAMKEKEASKDGYGDSIAIGETLEEPVEEINLVQFVKRNKMYVLLNLGVVGIFFSNQVLNTYMIQIVESVGGNSEDMGRILSMMAFLEIPMMVSVAHLRKYFSCQFMLKVASIGYTVKIAAHYLATSVAMVYAAQLFQLVSFALFLPAMIIFIDEVMSKGEAVKGQALYTMMTTVTTILASLIGGIVLDLSGAKMLTLVGTVITAIGAVVIFATVDKVKRHE